jgi:hypothetical protein
MNRRLLAFLGAASLTLLLGSRAYAQERVKMTDAEKIAWYCENHQDEGENCTAHARLMLPYISDYARYSDSDTRGNTVVSDPNGCDFSPLPDGCPGASSPGAVTSGPADGNGGGAGSNGGGAGSNGGGAAAGNDGGLTTSGLPWPPAHGCVDAAKGGFNVEICSNLAAMRLHQGGHGGLVFPNSKKVYSVGFLPGGGSQDCITTTTPRFIGQGCSAHMWLSKEPAGGPVGTCTQPFSFGGGGGADLSYEIGDSSPPNSCVLKRGTRYFCNIVLDMEDADWYGNVPDENGVFARRRKLCNGIISGPLGADSYAH